MNLPAPGTSCKRNHIVFARENSLILSAPGGKEGAGSPQTKLLTGKSSRTSIQEAAGISIILTAESQGQP